MALWKARAPRSETNVVIILGMIAETVPWADPFVPLFTPSIFRKGWWEVSEACLGSPQTLCIVIHWSVQPRNQWSVGKICFGLRSYEGLGRITPAWRRPPIDLWLPVLKTRAAGTGIHSTQRYVVAQLFGENDISGPEARRGAVLTKTETHKKVGKP
ncbi:hypothetical protein C8R45DRAFT_936845 [Mycena sanguinolenta]|nr:hypothetical protein C8R45DRAFT_936845 [Mycena sanguinolenta]